jgi:hypothetical protein
MTDAAIGAGHQNDFVGKHHNTGADTEPMAKWALRIAHFWQRPVSKRGR